MPRIAWKASSSQPPALCKLCRSNATEYSLGQVDIAGEPICTYEDAGRCVNPDSGTPGSGAAKEQIHVKHPETGLLLRSLDEVTRVRKPISLSTYA